MTAWRPATSVRAGIQSRGPRKSETTTTTPGVVRIGADQREGTGGRCLAAALLGRLGGDGAQEAEHPAIAAGRRRDVLAAGAEGDDAEPVAAPGREATDDEGGALGHVGLAPVGRPEVHRRGVVEQEPGRQLPVRHVLADLRDERPGGGVPVDLANVVAGLVRPDAVELEAGAVAATEVVAGHLATDAPVERQLELPDEPVGDRAGPGSGGRPVAPADASEVGARTLRAGNRHAVGSTAISRRGAGTRVRTRSMMVSAVIPSASAA